MILEDCPLTHGLEVARPEANGKAQRFAVEQRFRRDPCRPPDSAEAPCDGCVLEFLLGDARGDRSDVDQVAQSTERILLPPVRRQDQGMMMWLGGDDAVDSAGRRPGCLQNLV